jgi:1,4-dihydroxy-2-naphthoate octaprenyltransferase
MKKEFFHGITLGVRIAFGGFLVALIGVVAGFLGFYINERWLSIVGLGATAIGVLIGFFGVACGWVRNAKSAVKGSFQAAKELRSKPLSRWRS